MKSWLKIVGAVLSLGAFLLVFQNCGDEVTFSSADPQSPISNNSNIVPISEDDVERLIDEVLDNTPIVDLDGKPYECDSVAKKEVALFTGNAKQAECKEIPVSPNPGNNLPSDPEKENLPDPVVDVDPENYAQLCANVKMIANKFLNGEDVLLNKASKNSEDVLIYAVSDTEVIGNLFSKVLIFPVDDKKMSNVNLIENIRGNKVFCGLKIGKLQKITGTTVIVNSEIGDMEDIVGKLVLVRSQIKGQKVNVTNNIQEF
jgi:hypothetical protein